jgi:pilus assembly protein CpaD
MQIVRTALAEEFARLRLAAGLVARAALVGGGAMFLVACNTDQQLTAGAPDVPYDYRQRHPITMTEGDRTLEVFVGTSRGQLNAGQRAEVAQFGHSWRREATGGIAIELPDGASNERAAADAVPTIRSILAATSVPPKGIIVRRYPAPGPNIAPIRVSYPRIMAQAGPCGIWPEDIGPSLNRDYFENQPVWNHGCSMQQSRRHGRRSGRPGAAARRNAGLHHAPYHRTGEISFRRFAGNDSSGRQRRQNQ